MRIHFSPMCDFPSPAGPETLSLSKAGETLTINGETFDLSGIPDGATLPAEATESHWFAGPIERIDGELHVTLVLPHPLIPEPWQAFPEPMTVTEDGPIDVPCDTTVTVEHQRIEGGTNIITTTLRWRQDPEVETVFVADPPEPEPQPEQEPADAD